MGDHNRQQIHLLATKVGQNKFQLMDRVPRYATPAETAPHPHRVADIAPKLRWITRDFELVSVGSRANNGLWLSMNGGPRTALRFVGCQKGVG